VTCPQLLYPPESYFSAIYLPHSPDLPEKDIFVKLFNGGLTSFKPAALTIGPNENIFVADR
jgi:hypothetical protein